MPAMATQPLTIEERMTRVEEQLRHTATNAGLERLRGELRTDMQGLKFTLAAWMLVLVSAATGIIIAVDRLAG